MLKVRAIRETRKNGKLTGFVLRDAIGKEMNASLASILNAVKLGKAEVENLSITGDTATLIEPEMSKSESIEVSETDKQRIEELTKLLNEARAVYEQGTDEIMSNNEYDKLYDELAELESFTGYSLSDSPIKNVGYEVLSKLEKEEHETPMLSLTKTKEVDDLLSFVADKDCVLSWKMDGLTVVIKYDNGVIEKGITRGNGYIGEVVTNNVKQFKNVPKKIPYTGKVVIRGEAVIKYSTFEKINSMITENDEKYKNPRNLCSGSVRQLDSGVTAKRDVEWYAFELVEGPEESGKLVSEQLDWLSKQGFSVVEHKVVNRNNLKAAIESFSNKLKGAEETKFDIPTDGLVITYNDRAYGLSLGQTSKSPRHSKAFKWEDAEAETKLRYVEWSTSRNGLITPVAAFDPVDIEGSTVSRASVHNVSIFGALQLGTGDTLKVYKANLIIPQISENLTRTGTCIIPGDCPCCGAPTKLHEEEASGVLTLWCTNPDCIARGNKLMEHFVSRDGMNIDGISGATLSRLCEEGIITDLPSIYHIKEYEDDIVNLDGFGEQSFYNMVNAIEKSRDVKLANLIYAIGIPNIGLATAKLICKHFGNDLNATVTAGINELLAIDGIGETIADSFCSYFSDIENADMFERLIAELNIIQEQVSTNTAMNGVTICVTGDVDIFPNRRAIKDLVENLGGKLTSSVSRSTTYLVTNDTSSGSRKNKDAEKYGIPILTEKEFIDKFSLSEYIN